MTILEECTHLMNNIIQDTISIMKRPDPIQRQLCKELGIAFNIELGEINSETKKILNDKSWRNKS